MDSAEDPPPEPVPGLRREVEAMDDGRRITYYSHGDPGGAGREEAGEE